MYGLPENFDASFLVDRNLEMICFNINQVTFLFDEHTMITVEGSVLHQLSESDDISSPVSPPIYESSLMQLLERSVSRAFGDEDGTLTLVFDNGHVLKCLDTYSKRESYQIVHGEHVVIV